MTKKILMLVCLVLQFHDINASDNYPRNMDVDVIHYEFFIGLNDSTDIIEGKTVIVADFKTGVPSFALDLDNHDKSGKGMEVSDVTVSGSGVKWKHENDRLEIQTPIKKGEHVIIISYSGQPSDGLIISNNKYGSRTFFSDHWPDRTHFYLPCIDHSYDKASVDFIIMAPDEYRVVANGNLIEESDLPGPMTLTRWSEKVPLAVKVMAFGAARFAVHSADSSGNIPVWSWVFPENREEGFSDYSFAVEPMDYFSDLIGEYPYSKLANVQSKTVWGGMENAGTIFYEQESVTGKGAEKLIAHEVAHQWFGNSITENDWHHVWLSEGFATYLAAMFMESCYGQERMKAEMKSAREEILDFGKRYPRPVIDITITRYRWLLNANTYEKGAWILHMLRNMIGDENFRKGLREYYGRYRNSNVMTQDFIGVMESVSGTDLKKFFHQWLTEPVQPELRIWTEKKGKGDLSICIRQEQEPVFDFTIELLVSAGDHEKLIKVPVNERQVCISTGETRITGIIPDPDVKLLYREVK